MIVTQNIFRPYTLMCLPKNVNLNKKHKQLVFHVSNCSKEQHNKMQNGFFNIAITECKPE